MQLSELGGKLPPLWLRAWDILRQGSATWGTRATFGTPSNFQWHAETPSFTYQFWYHSQEVLLTLSCTKTRMYLAHWMIWNLNSARIYQKVADPCLSLCDCFGIFHILPNQQVFRKNMFHYWKNVFAGQIWPAGRSLETLPWNITADWLSQVPVDYCDFCVGWAMWRGNNKLMRSHRL